MAGLTGAKPSASYKSLLRVDDSTNGVDGTLEVVTDGEGTESPLKVSTTNVTVLDHQVNTQYAYFGCASSAALPPIADTHYPVAFSSMLFSSSTLSLGNGANPALVLDISGLNQADDLVTYLWYIPDDITVAGVYVWASPDGATGDALTFHLMSYTIDTSLDAAGDGGDLSSGVVVADHVGTVTSDGYESTINQSLTIQSANIDAGDVAMFTMAADGTNGNYAMNVTVKYYLR